MSRKEYEEMYCPSCEEWLPEWDMTYVESSEDYPRGTHMCLEHYKDEFPHDECIVCLRKEAIHEMTPMGFWDDEELFFCAPCLEFYPTPKEATQ